MYTPSQTVASLNLPALQDLADEGGYTGETVLSSFSAVLLLSACRAFLHDPRNWTGAAHYLTPTELDEIDELVSEAESELMSATAPAGRMPDYVFYQQVGSGADGGDLDSGAYRDRLMTLIDVNRDGLASIDAGTFNVPTDDYWIYAFAQGRRIRENNLRVVDDATQVVVSSTQAPTASSRAADPSTQSQAELYGEVRLLIGIDYILQHRCSTTRSNDGQGEAASWLTDNIYSGVMLTKVNP